eukprot:138953-Chlamydomonas_euryale.AAC.1
MSVRCNTCGNFMYKGTKFNTRMEDVAGETYLGLKIFRFYYRCPNCAAEFCMKTDPQSTDYVLEGGATRNYEPWRDKEVEKKEAAQEREEEEMGNAMKVRRAGTRGRKGAECRGRAQRGERGRSSAEQEREEEEMGNAMKVQRAGTRGRRGAEECGAGA